MRLKVCGAAALLIAMLGCGVGDVSISITPTKATVIAGQTYQFSASVGSAGNKGVFWVAERGAVSLRGLYQAPNASEPGIDHVSAYAEADTSKVAVADITVLPAVTVTPGAEVLVAPGGTINFSAVLTGTSDASVVWSVEEDTAGGTIDPVLGTYTAPATIGTYHVIATSNADGTKAGRVTVIVG